MIIVPAHIVAMGNAFFVESGWLMAAPILIDNTIEWDEAVMVDDDGDGDPAVLAQIRYALGLVPRV